MLFREPNLQFEAAVPFENSTGILSADRNGYRVLRGWSCVSCSIARIRSGAAGGTTGAPKGVMVEHGHVARLFAATQAQFQFDDSDVWTLFHSFAFDFSVWEIWGALLYGGRLVVVPGLCARTPSEFYGLLSQEGVTVLNQTPSAFRSLMAAQGHPRVAAVVTLAAPWHFRRYPAKSRSALARLCCSGWVI